VREADNLTTFMCRMSWKSGSLNLLEPSGPHRAYYGTPFKIRGHGLDKSGSGKDPVANYCVHGNGHSSFIKVDDSPD